MEPGVSKNIEFVKKNPGQLILLLIYTAFFYYAVNSNQVLFLTALYIK
jgi:hypothetical protein